MLKPGQCLTIRIILFQGRANMTRRSTKQSLAATWANRCFFLGQNAKLRTTRHQTNTRQRWRSLRLTIAFLILNSRLEAHLTHLLTRPCVRIALWDQLPIPFPIHSVRLVRVLFRQGTTRKTQTRHQGPVLMTRYRPDRKHLNQFPAIQ